MNSLSYIVYLGKSLSATTTAKQVTGLVTYGEYAVSNLSDSAVVYINTDNSSDTPNADASKGLPLFPMSILFVKCPYGKIDYIASAAADVTINKLVKDGV